MKTYEKLIQKRLRSLFAITKPTVKNTFKVAILVMLFASCEKAELITPDKPVFEFTEVHISMNHSRVMIGVDGKYKEIGDVNTHSLHVIKLDKGQEVSAMIMYGKSMSATVYSGNTRTKIGTNDFFRYTAK